MNAEQKKAGKKLKAALRECHKAELVVHAFTDVGFFVVPLEALEQDVRYERDEDPQKFHDEHGVNCDPSDGFMWDAGAGV